MEHAEALELLEDAAIEPHGFERLAAGDTPEAASLAGHLAGCSSCAAEFDRLRRSSTIVREAVRSMPPADLRERTLAFVAAVGRDRSGTRGDAVESAVSTPSGAPVPIDRPRKTSLRFGGAALLGSVAAAVLISVIATAGFFALRPAQPAPGEVAGLARAASWVIRIEREPDATSVALTSASGDASGSLYFSPATTDLAVLAQGLELPAAGTEYRCWVEESGTRTLIGKMFFSGEIAHWAGPSEAVGDLPDGSTFGVSLESSTGSAVDGEPVLTGEL
jgi:hypothetical protein